MSASSDRPAVPVAGPSTNTKEKKKKSKKRKRSASPFDFENEPVPEGDMDAEEFFVGQSTTSRETVGPNLRHMIIDFYGSRNQMPLCMLSTNLTYQAVANPA